MENIFGILKNLEANPPNKTGLMLIKWIKSGLHFFIIRKILKKT
jgi:hypothetical protein